MGNLKRMEECFGIEDLITLVPEGLTQSTTLKEAYMIILREEFGLQRHLPLLIPPVGFKMLKRVLVNQDYSLQDTYFNMLNLFNIRLTTTVIRQDENGHFYSEVRLTRELEDGFDDTRSLRVTLYTGLAAVVASKGQICISREDFERLYVSQPGDSQVAVPIAAMTDTLLNEALQQAVKNEWFELASKLRDELKSRNNGMA